MARQPDDGRMRSYSAATKRLAESQIEAKSRRDNRGNSGFGESSFTAGRTDRNKLAGLGMTRAGVNRKAISAGNLESLNYMNGDVGFMNPEFGNDINAILEFGGPVSYDIPYEEIERRRYATENDTRQRYGMPALSPIQSDQLYGRFGKRPQPYEYLNYGSGPKYFKEQTRPGYIEYDPRFGPDMPKRIGGY